LLLQDLQDSLPGVCLGYDDPLRALRSLRHGLRWDRALLRLLLTAHARAHAADDAQDHNSDPNQGPEVAVHRSA
jgi:hypothetical protein